MAVRNCVKKCPGKCCHSIPVFFEDDKEAVKWYLLAADQGYAAAQHNLGVMCSNGRGVPEDYVLAYMWANIAGANGHDISNPGGLLTLDMTQADVKKAHELTRLYIKDNPKFYRVALSVLGDQELVRIVHKQNQAGQIYLLRARSVSSRKIDLSRFIVCGLGIS